MHSIAILETAPNRAAISRRRFLAAAGSSAATLALAPGSLFAQDKSHEDKPHKDIIVPTMYKEAASAGIETKFLRRNISVLMGSGGNIAVLTGKDGKVLIDAGFSSTRPRIAEALAAISADPVKQLINTHWHVDHTDGNAWLHESGATITAHENTRKHLSVDTLVEGWSTTFPAAPTAAIPAIVFDGDHSLHLNDTSIALKHYAPAHTDSDISVTFKDANIIHVGDTWWNGIYPFIDYSTGGNINGMVHATEQNLAAANDNTILIPGHGPVGNKAQLAEYHDMLISVRGKIAGLKKEGKSLDETIAAKPTAEFDARYGQFLIDPVFFTGLVYIGV